MRLESVALKQSVCATRTVLLESAVRGGSVSRAILAGVAPLENAAARMDAASTVSARANVPKARSALRVDASKESVGLLASPAALMDAARLGLAATLTPPSASRSVASAGAVRVRVSTASVNARDSAPGAAALAMTAAMKEPVSSASVASRSAVMAKRLETVVPESAALRVAASPASSAALA